MALPVNPSFSSVASVAAIASNVTNALGNNLGTGANNLASLNNTVDRLSGAAGTALNGFTAAGDTSLNSLTSGFGNPVNTVVGGISDIGSALGGIGTAIGGVFGSAPNLATGLLNVAGAVSKAAGQINDILSLKRGGSLPSGADLFATSGSAISVNPASAADWRVRIWTAWENFNSPLFKRLEDTGGVVFPYLPAITISTKANYNTVEPVHSNYPFYAYKNSSVEEIQIAGDFSVEVETDAEYWIAATTFFKTATKMFFGQGENAGNPPIICKLGGYGTSIFNNTPVIIKSFSVDLKDDVQYIRSSKYNTWVPIMSSITVVCAPIYNRTRLRQFNLKDYAKGDLTNGFI
jgi:hypothetical protein